MQGNCRNKPAKNELRPFISGIKRLPWDKIDIHHFDAQKKRNRCPPEADPRSLKVEQVSHLQLQERKGARTRSEYAAGSWIPAIFLP